MASYAAINYITWANKYIDSIKLGDEWFDMEMREAMNFLRILNKCESPIEKILLLEMISRFFLTADDPEFLPEWSDSLSCDFNYAIQSGLKDKVPTGLLGLGVTVTPQKNIVYENHSYRADFELQVRYDRQDDYTHRSCLQMVVETDGHNFHEKTKRQAARDKQRDRILMRAGYKVLHFTGSEVYKSPKNTVDEIIKTIVTSINSPKTIGKFDG